MLVAGSPGLKVSRLQKLFGRTVGHSAGRQSADGQPGGGDSPLASGTARRSPPGSQRRRGPGLRYDDRNLFRFWFLPVRVLPLRRADLRSSHSRVVRRVGAVLPRSKAAAGELGRGNRNASSGRPLPATSAPRRGRSAPANAVGTGKPRRTTLATIAAEAGVSLPTVSKVVNGRPDVAPATRALVERLLDQHRYTRAGARRHRRSGIVDLVFNGLDSPWAVEILRGVEEWGAAQSTAVAVCSVRHGNARPASWTSGLASHDTDGVILVTSELTGSQLEQLRNADIPLVVLDPGNPPPPDLPSVGATNWAGGLAATEHLLTLGHRRIGDDRRARGLPLQPGENRRVPVGAGTGGHQVRPGTGPQWGLPARVRLRMRRCAARPPRGPNGDLCRQ